MVVAAEGDEVLAFGALALSWMGGLDGPPKPPKRSQHPGKAVALLDIPTGSSLVLDRLVALARARGHHSMIARITGENEASLRLHERHGFVQVGRERETAFKLGRWLDVLTLQLML